MTGLTLLVSGVAERRHTARDARDKALAAADALEVELAAADFGTEVVDIAETFLLDKERKSQKDGGSQRKSISIVRRRRAGR